MHSSNPALAVAAREAGAYNFGGADLAATLSGTATKALVLAAVTLAAGYAALYYTLETLYGGGAVPALLIYGSLIAALAVAVITIFRPHLSPATAPLYAVLEGAALGSLSGMFELKYPGIASTAVLSTFVVVLTMLALWRFRIVVPTARFRAIVTGAVGGIFVLYLIDMAVRLFGASFLPAGGPLAIGVSLIICAVASFSLVLDFDNIEQAVNRGLPRYFEYFNAFSLLVTICWLYIEILKLLAHRE